MSYGYTGKILRVNLSTGQTNIEKPSEIFYRTYLGGRGFTAYYLLKELEQGIDPLGPENKLIFACGVLTGLPVAGMSRFVVGSKSPLTGGLGQSEAGGFWGPELKKAGYDAIIVEGKSPEPVYISIGNGEIKINDAMHLWGKETGEVQDLIRKDLGDDRARIVQIGPGGEKLVRYACITNDLKHYNGRNGMGAVMGSKNLRAIAVIGTKQLLFADNRKIKDIGKKYLSIYMEHPLSRGLYQYGTAGVVDTLNATGILPTKNFNYGEFDGTRNINGDALVDSILKKREGCYACAIRCKRVVGVENDDIYVDSKYGGPEYESIAAFGSLCLVDDINIIAKANEICNRYGIDTISTGASIAFTMECFEKGILTARDTGGIQAEFGNGKAVLELAEMIGKREGIGDLLAEGTSIAAKKIGRGAESCTVYVKGQELPMHDPRGKTGVGIGLAVSQNASDHMVAPHDSFFGQKGFALDSIAPLGIFEPIDPKDLSWKKVRLFAYLERLWSFYNMVGICFFGPAPRGAMPMMDVIELIKAATGWDLSLWDMMKAGERSINISRAFNAREGFNKNDDVLPEKLLHGLKNGRLEGVSIDRKQFDEAVLLYYGMMGWNKEGTPSKAKLLELNLDWVSRLLY